MIEGRREKRESARFEVQLSNLDHLLVTEWASTQNVNIHGLRIETGRHWQPGTHLLIKSFRDEPLAIARVVYCQTLRSETFALGLEFLARAGE